MNKKICIAKIVNVHGIKGEVKIKTYTENEDDIFDFKNITDAAGNVYKIVKRTVSKGCIIAKINNVNNRTDAETFKGKLLFVERSELPDTKEDEFYYTDLIGMDVINDKSEKLGKVKAIHNFGYGDIVEIEFAEAVNNNLFAFTTENFPTINLEERSVLFVKNDIISVQK